MIGVEEPLAVAQDRLRLRPRLVAVSTRQELGGNRVGALRQLLELIDPGIDPAQTAL